MEHKAFKQLFWGILLALLAGLGFGLINGLLAERVRIPAFIATLGT